MRLFNFWEVQQQEAMMRVSNLQDKRKNLYKLEPGYEARARRIASVYAKIYLEQENHGNKDLIGRYYWMGLGAFASKTVAAIFKHGLTAWGYKWIPLGVFVILYILLQKVTYGYLWILHRGIMLGACLQHLLVSVERSVMYQTLRISKKKLEMCLGQVVYRLLNTYKVRLK